MRRIALEAAALVLLSLACAWLSNAFAGPARHLGWHTREVRAVATVAPKEPAPAAAPVPPTPKSVAPKSATPKPAAPVPAAPLPAAPVPAASKSTAATTAAPATPVPAAPKADPAAEVAARFPALTGAPTADLSAEDARWLHGRGVLFLDARRTAQFVQGHIAGARCLSPWEDGLVDKVERLAMFAKDLKAPVVVYCSGGDCQDSHLLAQKLWLAGFRNLRIYTGGYPDWETRHWPITTGDTR